MMQCRLRPLGRVLFAFLVVAVLRADAQSIRTPAEESAFSRYSQYADIIRFLETIDRAAREATVLPVGQTLPMKDFPAANLYLCVITQEGVGGPRALKRNKPTVMIVASQHGNEQSAKEAALQLIRDLAVGDLKPLLKQLNFLVLPQANPYGNFVNRRQNEQELDLNRDHVKLEAPETRAIHEVFREWMPEVTLDLHEKGDDYYRVSTGCVSNVNIAAGLEKYSRERLFPAIEKRVSTDGFTWHEYLITESVGSLQAAGVPDRAQRGQPREIQMRYSTTDLNDGRNSLGIYETLSFIQECSSRHDIPTLQERTRWQYSGIRALIQEVANNGKEVLKLVRDQRAGLLRKARKPAPDDMIYLRMHYVRDPAQPELTLKQFVRTQGQPGSAPVEQKVETIVVKNWLSRVESTLSVPRPAGYVIPASFAEVIKNLLDHKISVGRISLGGRLAVESYEVKDVVPSQEDYLAPERLEVAKRSEESTVKEGDFFVSVDQPAADLIPCLLEPESEYGLIRYRSFKLAPEKGSVFPILRVTRGKPSVTLYGAAAAAR